VGNYHLMKYLLERRLLWYVMPYWGREDLAVPAWYPMTMEEVYGAMYDVLFCCLDLLEEITDVLFDGRDITMMPPVLLLFACLHYLWLPLFITGGYDDCTNCLQITPYIVWCWWKCIDGGIGMPLEGIAIPFTFTTDYSDTLLQRYSAYWPYYSVFCVLEEEERPGGGHWGWEISCHWRTMVMMEEEMEEEADAVFCCILFWDRRWERGCSTWRSDAGGWLEVWRREDDCHYSRRSLIWREG